MVPSSFFVSSLRGFILKFALQYYAISNALFCADHCIFGILIYVCDMCMQCDCYYCLLIFTSLLQYGIQSQGLVLHNWLCQSYLSQHLMQQVLFPQLFIMFCDIVYICSPYAIYIVNRYIQLQIQTCIFTLYQLTQSLFLTQVFA